MSGAFPSAPPGVCAAVLTTSALCRQRRFPAVLGRDLGRDVDEPEELAEGPDPAGLHQPQGPHLQHERRGLGRDHPVRRSLALPCNLQERLTRLPASPSLIAHDKVRMATIPELETLPFFYGMRFKALRETQAPFVPSLENEMDVGYYDDFSNEADLAKYGACRS